MAPKLLKIYRMAMGMGQTQIAESLGMHRQAWERFEAGRSRPGTDKLYQLSKITGWSMEELYLDYTPESRDQPLGLSRTPKRA